MATYGSGIRIDSTNIYVTRTSNGTLYTVPAAQAVYGQLSLDGGGSGQITVSGNNLWTGTFAATERPIPCFLGPAQVVALIVSGGSCRLTLSGILYSN